jgi:UDP:flavonoid glycosyltransferase YjiC (YdhE family)
LLAPTVEALGFDALPVGPDAAHSPPRRIALREVDLEREEREFRERFVAGGARIRAIGTVALCADWQPDLVVCEETDLGTVVAAERLGLPHATVLVMAARSFVRAEVVAEPLYELRAQHGLGPDPNLAAPSRYLVLSPFPPSFRDPAFPLPPTGHAIRLSDVKRAPRDGVPVVYFTLGTVFNLESGDLFERVLAGLGELPIEVEATVGSQIDPGELGPLPDNVSVEQYVAQSEVLARSSAVVSHGGSGTVVAALAHGLPQVVLPMGADQPLNAARCEDLGVGVVLDAVSATPEQVREAVSVVLSDPAYRSAAERIKAEIAALPGPDHAVELLERLL